MNPRTYSCAFRSTPMPTSTKNTLHICDYILLILEVSLAIILLLTFQYISGDSSIATTYAILCSIISIFTAILGIFYYHALYTKWYTPEKLAITKIALFIGSLVLIYFCGIIGLCTILTLFVGIIPKKKSARLTQVQAQSPTKTTSAHIIQYQSTSTENMTDTSTTQPNDITVDYTTPAVMAAQQYENRQKSITIVTAALFAAANLLSSLWIWFIPSISVITNPTPTGGEGDIIFLAVFIAPINIAIGLIPLIITSSKHNSSTNQVFYWIATFLSLSPIILTIILLIFLLILF